MLLLTGPAGSGKSFRVLERFRDALRLGDPGVRLLTPTATMAQHLQHQMAREGFVFRPALIQTLSRFVDSFAAGYPQVSDPLFYLIVEEAARRANRAEFAQVVRLPGFCAALARTLEEFSSAGCDAARLEHTFSRISFDAPLVEAFLAVYREADRELTRRGLAMRSQRLSSAAARIASDGLAGAHTILLDGFYALPDPELGVIEAICRHADVTVTVPTAKITEPTRERLLAMGFVEETCRREAAQPRIDVCEAPAIEREAEEIARRILEQYSAGRAFREIGIIVRSPEIYEPILRATLDRFGIPARFYFDGDLAQHALVRFLAGTVDAMLGGWEHGETLAPVRLAPGVASDEFDFTVKEQMPASGLEALQRMAAERAKISELLQSFTRFDQWRTISLAPGQWAIRLSAMREMFAPGWPEPSDYEAAAVWRSQAAVLGLFESAMDETARALPDRAVTLAVFWRAAKSVLRLMPLRVDDRRRNVVHVLGAHEARQWRLSVVFVCGLVEKQFPKFHMQEPFFPEPARAQLKQAGIRLRTTADFEAEERFLFNSAVTRATETLMLSYPRFDARGQQNLRSIFLDGLPAVPSPWQAVRPRQALHRNGAFQPARITSPDLIQALSLQHTVFKPTALESYLQCAFQFFGRYTVDLKPAPVPPEERLNFMVEGNIIHGVLAELARGRGRLEEIFEQVFRGICKEERIPAGYRMEACRERLLADLRNFLDDTQWPLDFHTQTEERFRYLLGGPVEIKGRIDRLDVAPDGRAFVIDYKYSRAENVKKRLGSDHFLQPQLYMLAAERFFGVQAAGMFYCGLRGGVTWAGWSDDSPLPANPIPPDWLRQATQTTLRVADEIRAGRVEPDPADPEQCARCDFRDVCRVETASAAVAEEA
jgi:RecB family exonuclease